MSIRRSEEFRAYGKLLSWNSFGEPAKVVRICLQAGVTLVKVKNKKGVWTLVIPQRPTAMLPEGGKRGSGCISGMERYRGL